MLRIAAGLSALYVVWGSTYLAVRYALVSLPPLGMSGIRFLVAGLILYAFSQRNGKLPVPPPRHWLSAALVGLLLMGCGNGFVAWGEETVPSGQAALLVASVPVWMALYEWLRPGGKFPGITVLVGLFLGTMGVVTLVGAPQGAPGAFGGCLIIMLSTLFWTAGSLASRSLPQPTDHFQFTGMSMLGGGVFLSLFSRLRGEVWPPFEQQLLSSWLAWAYLVVVGSLIGMTLYTWLLRVASPMLVSTYSYVNPVVAVALAWAVGEALPANLGSATLLVVTGVAMVSLGKVKFPKLAPEVFLWRLPLIGRPMVASSPKIDRFL